MSSFGWGTLPCSSFDQTRSPPTLTCVMRCDDNAHNDDDDDRDDEDRDDDADRNQAPPISTG